jgi:pimeloyl-ACP methyl ester carboxylesterase
MASMTTPAGQTVAYSDTGTDGPALVLLHSFAMDGSMFAAQIATFGDTYRCIAIDERGHGGTPGDTPFTYWDVADDVLAVLDHLEIDDAVLAGVSQGGFIALRVALTAPERVRGLVLMGTSAAAEDPAVVQEYRAIAQTWEEHGATDALVGTLAEIGLGKEPADPWKDRWRHIPGPVFSHNLETLVTRDEILSRLGEVTAPALVLHGSADAAYPVARAEEIAQALPAARPLVVVPGGAHFLSLTNAAEVGRQMTAFLEDVAPAGVPS